MKRSKRRVLAFLLCVFMLLGTGMSAMAGETGTTGPDVENNHTVTPGSTDEPDSNQPADSQTGIETGNEEEKEISEKNETQDAATGDDTSEKQISVDHQFTYEDENISVVIHVAGNVSVVKQTEMSDEISAQELEMTVVPTKEDQPEYQAVETYVAENGGEESLIDISVADLEFTCGGQPVDVSACEITAEVTPTDKLQKAADAIETEDVAEEAEIGVELTALQSTEEGRAEAMDTVIVEKDEKTPPVMTLELNAAKPMLQLVARSALNPKFTVQYYANLEMTDRDSGGYLKIINTDNGGSNKGGNLPENGEANPSMTGLYLVDGGGAKREIRTSMELTELYTANEYEYFEAPSLPYVNIFRENGNYTANEVWVLKEGKDPSSTNEADWDVTKGIVDATELHFTNNPDKANEPNTILIKEGTVIRLVANQTKSDYENAATFYDYDITDNGSTTWDGTNGSHGINSGSNYSGSGAKLAFGNVNTGTGLGNESWNGNTLNKFNEPNRNNNLQGTTFGLVTGLDGNGHIQYAGGVDAPNLFDDGGATGKTVYNGWVQS